MIASSGVAMGVVLAAGLAGAVASELGLALAEREAARFPDGEMHVEIRTSVRGHDVYLIQPTSPPAEEYLLQLLLLADGAIVRAAMQGGSDSARTAKRAAMAILRTQPS